MKILWFSLTSSNFASQSSGYHGGGWISSLESAVAKQNHVELAVAFFHPSQVGRTHIGNVTYYPMRRPQSIFARIDRFFRLSAQDVRDIALCKAVIDDFKPDIIQVFGTESNFGLIAREMNLPFVIHLQGLMEPCLNAWVPSGYRMRDYAFQGSRNPVRIALGIRALAFNRHAAEREREIMHSCKAFIGRTEWDHAFVSLHAPQARYYSCWEALRPCFYKVGEWTPPAKPVFVSTLSRPLYKGHDVVLKTARTLKESGLNEFEWRVYGVQNLRLAERKTGIRANDVGVRPMGVATAEELRNALLNASLYVHPSYIDNSPNSICEAQVLGVPIVATNVGGVSSLFTPDRRHCLVPANDPLMTAFRIREVLDHPTAFLSDRVSCLRRHDPDAIAKTLLGIYRERIEEEHMAVGGHPLSTSPEPPESHPK